LGNGAKSRQSEWTDSIAAGSKSFIEKFKSLLGVKAKGRSIMDGGERYHLREEAVPYMALLRAKKKDIGPQNTYFWDITVE
jgi:putative transposase